MRDFSLSIYKSLLEKFLDCRYTIYTFEEFLKSSIDKNKILILRHDVDKKPLNSLAKAVIENKLGISSTYYFGVVKSSYNEAIIRKIKELGHEIAYHYEDLTLDSGNKNKAIELFQSNLNHLRQLYPVKTICMHVSPMSKWYNLDLWSQYDYKSYDIIGEPNFELDFNKIFYLTDSGMAWNQRKYAVRDVAKGNCNINIASTDDIIKKLSQGILPESVMINTHPQRCSDNNIEWVWEIFSQTLKNQLKRLVKKRIKGDTDVN